MLSQYFGLALATMICCCRLSMADSEIASANQKKFNVASELHKTLLAVTAPTQILMGKCAEQLKKDYTASLKASKNISSEFFQKLYGIQPVEHNGILIDFYRDLEAYLDGKVVDVVESTELFFDGLFPLVYRYVLTDESTMPGSSRSSDLSKLTKSKDLLGSMSNGDFSSSPSPECLMTIRRDLSPRPFGDAPVKLGSRLRKSLHAARGVLNGLRIGAAALHATSQLTNPCVDSLCELNGCLPVQGACEAVLSSDSNCLHRVGVVVHREWEELVDRLTRSSQMLLQEYNLIDISMTIPTKISDAIMHSVNTAHKYYDKIPSLCPEISRLDRMGGLSAFGKVISKSDPIAPTNQEPLEQSGKSVHSGNLPVINGKDSSGFPTRTSSAAEGTQLLDENRERLRRMLDSISSSRNLFSRMTEQVCGLYGKSWREHGMSEVTGSKKQDCLKHARISKSQEGDPGDTAAVLLDVLQGSSDMTNPHNKPIQGPNKRHVDDSVHRHGNADESDDWLQADQAGVASGDDYYGDDEYPDEDRDYNDHGRYNHNNRGSDHGRDIDVDSYDDEEGSAGSGDEEELVDRNVVLTNEHQKNNDRKVDFEFDNRGSSVSHVTQPVRPVNQPTPDSGGVAHRAVAYFKALGLLLSLIANQYLFLIC